jgi:hypothetical protein
MCGSSPPKDNSVQLRQLELDEQRRQEEIQAQKDAVALEEYNQRLNSAYTGAIDQGRQTIASRGLTEDEFMPLIMSKLQSLKGSVPKLDAAPATYFEGAADSALNSERDRRRASYGSQFDKFAQFGFDRDLIGDTMDDDTINAIIAEDEDRAINEANRARDRGALNETGYKAATDSLGRQRYSIESRLQDLGAGVLEEGRNTLRNTASGGRQAAQNYELGSTFNPLAYNDTINNDFTGFRNALAGRIRGKVGTAPLFDTSQLLNIGGAAQGAVNNRSIGDLISTGAKEDDDERGLGTTGAF